MGQANQCSFINPDMSFAEMVLLELGRAREFHPEPINSLHEGLAVAWEEFEELKAEVFRKGSVRSDNAVLTEAVQTASMIQRMVEDLGYAKR